MQEIKILKVRFNKITLKEASDLALQWANGNEQKYITTPNPEILLAAQKNHKFLRVLNHSNLNIPDGIGILWAAKYQKITQNTNSKLSKFIKWLYSIPIILIYPKFIKDPLPQRVTGSDLMQEICKNSTIDRIFLLGASKGVAEKVREKLEKKNPSIKIVGTYAGSPKIDDEKNIISMIDRSKANIIFVAYGAPSQELWIARNLKKMPSLKLAIGIGGAFNFIAGTKKRAPKWMQKSSLEWLFRLIQEPSRIKRIFNATIRFSVAVLRANLKN